MTKKIIATTLFSVFLLGTFAYAAYAYSLTPRESLNFDETLYVKGQEVYGFPEKILITRIHGAPDDITKDPESWLGMIYYYYVTRLEFADLPYNFIVDRQGDVYQGREGWDGLIPELDTPEGAVMIAYLSNGSDITIPAQRAFEELVEDLSYTYGIQKEGVQVVDISLASKEEGELSKLLYQKAEGTFPTEMLDLASYYSYSKEDHTVLGLEVSDVESATEVAANTDFDVSLTITNTGEFPWFTFNDYIYLVTKDGEDSDFALNKEWDGFDTPLHVEGVTVFPEDSQEIKFKMHTPFFPGEYSETFGFKRLGDSKIIKDSEFTVDFTVGKGDFELVEITETGAGYLNVRAEASLSSATVGKVTVGEVYLMSEKSNGWYKIFYNDSDEGWVLGEYVRQL